MKAREYSNRFAKNEYDQAIALFKQAIELDPRFALAYAGLADAYSFSLVSGAPLSILDTSIATSQKALALDPNLAEGYEALGYAFQSKGWLQKSMEMEKKALELNPNYARAAGVLGKILWQMGRLDESLFWVKKYQQLDPTLFLTARYVGDVHRILGNVNEAKKWYKHCLALDPNARECYVQLMLTATLYGSYEEIKPLEEKLLAIAADEPQTLYVLRTAELVFAHYDKAEQYSLGLPEEWKDALAGEKTNAKKIIAQLQEDSKHRYVPSQYIAFIYLGLGDLDDALFWLEKGYQEGTLLVGVDLAGYFPILRSDARFADFLRRIHVQ